MREEANMRKDGMSASMPARDELLSPGQDVSPVIDGSPSSPSAGISTKRAETRPRIDRRQPVQPNFIRWQASPPPMSSLDSGRCPCPVQQTDRRSPVSFHSRYGIRGTNNRVRLPCCAGRLCSNPSRSRGSWLGEETGISRRKKDVDGIVAAPLHS